MSEQSEQRAMPATQAIDPENLVPFRHIVEQTPDAVIFADTGGLIRIWNRGAEAVFGFSAAEAVGSSLDIIIAERFRRAHWEGYHRAMTSGRTRHGAQVRTTRAIHKDGRKLYVELSFGVIVNDAGATLGSVAVGRDGSARQLADGALRSRLAELEGKAGSGVLSPIACAVTAASPASG